MKYTKEQIEKMKDLLIEATLEQCDDSVVADILREGCPGYDNFEDAELIEEFENRFGEDYLKIEE